MDRAACPASQLCARRQPSLISGMPPSSRGSRRAAKKKPVIEGHSPSARGQAASSLDMMEDLPGARLTSGVNSDLPPCMQKPKPCSFLCGAVSFQTPDPIDAGQRTATKRPPNGHHLGTFSNEVEHNEVCTTQ